MKLKSQNKNRRLRKSFIFILSIILTLSICLIEGFKKPYKADTYYKGYTTQYGSYSLVETNIFGNTRVQSLFMYAFNGVYNGRIRIYYTQASYNGTDSILPINCTIESRSDSYLQVTFKNVSEICIIFQNANLNPIDITSVTYPGDTPMTKITNGTNNQLETIETILYTIQSNVQTINTNVSDIESAINTGNGYLNNQNNTLSNINTNVNSILTELQDYFTDSNGVTINIGDIILQFNEFNANLQLQLGLLTNLKTICENILQSINNIDNQIDKISWTTIINGSNLQYSQDGINNYSNTTGNVPADYYFNIGNFNINNYTSSYKNLYQISLSYGNFSRMLKVDDIEFYCLRTNNNNLQRFYPDDVYIQYNRINFMIYFSVHDDSMSGGTPWGNDSQLVIKIKLPGYLYSKNAFIKYINSEDIEYWKILNCIKTFNNYISQENYYTSTSSQLLSILNAINNLNISVTNTTVNDTQVNIENYNDIMTDIENIEINFNTQFNTNNNNIEQNDINPPNLTVFGQDKLILTKVTNELLMYNSKIKYIVYIILLGLVVVRILG